MESQTVFEKGWELDRLFEQTILAMRSCEGQIEQEMKDLGLQE